MNMPPKPTKYDRQLDTLEYNLEEYFKAQGKWILIDYSNPIRVGGSIDILSVVTKEDTGTTIQRQVTSSFDGDWTAEKWIEFEQECKENL